MNKALSPNDIAVLDAVPTEPPAKAGKKREPKVPPRTLTPDQVKLLKASVRAFAKSRQDSDASDPFRTEVLPMFEQTRTDYLSLARRAALELSKKLKRPISVDDVRAVAPPPAMTADGKPVDGRVMGAVFMGQDWVAVEHVRSKRTTCHKRHVMLFDRA